MPTVVDLDTNGNVKVYMDKSRTNNNVIKKYQDVDRWANANIDKIQAAITDRDGSRVSNQAAIVELPNGEYRVVSVKPKEGYNISKEDEFVSNLGDKFTAAVSKKVFKNESVMAVPKVSEETINIEQKSEDKILANVYPGEDIETFSKLGLPLSEYSVQTTDSKIEDFLKSASPELKQDLEDMGIHTKEAMLNDYAQGRWSSIDDYLKDAADCK